jgi:hypothetical protein
MWPVRKPKPANKPHFNGAEAYVHTEFMNGLTRIIFPIKEGGYHLYDFLTASSGRLGLKQTIVDEVGQATELEWVVRERERHLGFFANYLKGYCKLTAAMPEEEVEKLFTVGIHRLTPTKPIVETLRTLSPDRGLTFQHVKGKPFHAPKLDDGMSL